MCSNLLLSLSTIDELGEGAYKGGEATTNVSPGHKVSVKQPVEGRNHHLLHDLSQLLNL